MYIGNDLQIAHPSYKIIDDISSGFNGSTTSFALQVSGATPVPFPISTQQVMISVNGVVQEPDPTGSAGFKLLGSNIVFSSAPANGHAFFGVINAGADYVTAGSEFPDGSATAPSFTFQDDQDTGWFRSGSGAVGYSANGVQTLTFDGNGLTVTGDASFVGDSAKNLLWDKSDGALEFADNAKATFGTGADLTIKHESNTTYATNITGGFYIQSNTLALRSVSQENYLVAAENGAVDLYHDNVKKFETNSWGIKGYGYFAVDGSSGYAYTAPDNAKVSLGTGNDLQLWHDSSNSYITNTTGVINIQAKQTENSIVLNPDGAVELYHNNVKKFETSSAGVTVTGTLLTDVLTIYDSTTPWITVGYQSGQDHRIQWDSSKLQLKADPNNDGNNSQIVLNVDNSDKLILNKDGEFGIGGANYGTSGQVLTSGGTGSAASWTTISAAPEITATASGAIAAGKSVAINSNGTVSEITTSFTAVNPPTRISISESNHDNCDQNDHIYDSSTGYWVGVHRVTAFGHNKYQYNLYKSTSNGGNFQSVSNTQQMLGSDNNATNGRLVKLEDGKVLFVYNYNNGNALHARRGTISGETMTWETCRETNSSGSTSLDQHTPSENFDLAYISDNKFMLVLRNPNANRAHAFVVTMSGLYWTKQHEVVINTTNEAQNCRVIWDSTNNCAVALYGSGSGGKVRSCTLSGNTMTWGTESSRFSPVTPEFQDLEYDKQADKYVIAWKDPGGSYSGQGRYCIASRSSNNMTVGSAAGFEGNSINDLSLSYNDETQRMSLSWFRQNYGHRINYGLTGSSSITWNGTPYTSGNYSEYIQLRYDPVQKRSLVFYRSASGGSTTTAGKIVAEMYNTGTLSSTSSSFVGFVDSAVSNGNTATIKVVGNTTTGQSGLTTGTKYYIGRAGNLVTTAETPEVVAGVALSASSLLIQ